jgi:hypothetical protein
VSLQSIHGKFIYADQAGQVFALTENIGNYEKFFVTTLDDGTYALRSFQGKYIYADPVGGVYAKGDAVQAWEKFDATWNVDGSVSLLSIAHQKYVYADFQGRIKAVSSEIGEWERFTVTSCEARLPTCVFLKGIHGKYVMATPNGDLAAASNTSREWETFKVVIAGESVAFKSVHGTYVYADPDGGMFAKGKAINAWEQFQVTKNPDETISLRSAHGKYVYADPKGQLRAVATEIGNWEKFSIRSCEQHMLEGNLCRSNALRVDYSPEQCNASDDITTMACRSTDTFKCGLRLSSNNKFGAGRFQTHMKAATGPGTASNFYLYTYGRDNGKAEPWNEIDFEVLGQHVGPLHSRIWTNFFVGHGTQFPEFISVPFDASADFHTYTIEVSCCSITWIVDGNTYRHVDLNTHQHRDMIDTIRSADFQVLLSFWGQNRTSGDWSEIGYLDDNRNEFPLEASFQGLELPSTNSCKDVAAKCPL